LVTTRDRFTSHLVVEEIGVISAGDVRSVNIFKDIAAAVLHMVSSASLHAMDAANKDAAMSLLQPHGFAFLRLAVSRSEGKRAITAIC
jgi:uncharacterized protein YbjQ (UPF0145 family)